MVQSKVQTFAWTKPDFGNTRNYSMSLVTTFFRKQFKLLYKEGGDISQKIFSQVNVIEI